MWLSRSLSLLFLTFVITACGFRPLYNNDPGNYNICYPIKIATIKDREGQILRNYLLDLLTPQGEPEKPLYLLQVTLTTNIRNTGINKDETTNRKEAVLRGAYTLKDFKTNKVILSGSTKAINSFNIQSETGTVDQNYYSDVVAEQYATKEATRLLAEKIVLLLSAKLELKR